MNETAFEKACPAMLNCALEDSCEFEHDEEAAKAKDDDSFEYVGLKLIFLVVIFVLGLGGGLLPLYLRSLTKTDAFMSLLNAFSGGIFLTTGLTHILPHVVESGAKVDYGEYPLPYALVMLGYMAIFMVERVLFHSHAHTLETEDEHDQVHELHNHSHGGHDNGHGHGHGGHGHGHGNGDESKLMPPVSKKTNPNAFINSLVLLVAISMHAILAGISLGMQSSRSNLITIMVAICSHKAPAAFSIGSKFIRNGMAFRQVLMLVVIFSLVTPLGIAIGIGVGTSSPMAALILEGLAAGTFIYVGAAEISTDEFETTARACDEAHTQLLTKNKSSVNDEEGGGKDGGHTHRVHAPPGRVARFAAFSAYAFGCLVILLSNLAPHADH